MTPTFKIEAARQLRLEQGDCLVFHLPENVPVENARPYIEELVKALADKSGTGVSVSVICVPHDWDLALVRTVPDIINLKA